MLLTRTLFWKYASVGLLVNHLAIRTGAARGTDGWTDSQLPIIGTRGGTTLALIVDLAFDGAG